MKDIAGQWYRVSDDTLDWHNQVSKVTGYIADHEYETSDELRYIADDKSAYKKEHVAILEKALEDLRTGRINVLVVRNTDRIDRSEDLYDLLKRVEKFGNGARIESVEESWLAEMTGLPRKMLTVTSEYFNAEYSRTIGRKVKDAHDTGRANGYWVGSVPFGHSCEGEKGRKTLVPHPVEAALVREAYQRIADGHSATYVARWLDEVAPQVIRKTGKPSPWRAKRVIDMVKRPVYKGVHPTATGYEALVSEELWEHANAALAARSFETGGRKGEHHYSGVIRCPECSAPLYHHLSTRNGKPAGKPKYRCSTGRRGVSSESPCPFPGVDYAEVNRAVEDFMSECHIPEMVLVTEGGDHERQAAIEALKAERAAAQKADDDDLAIELSQQIKAMRALPPRPVITKPRRTGKTYAELWNAGNLLARRSILGSIQLVIIRDEGGIRATFAEGFWGEEDAEA